MVKITISYNGHQLYEAGAMTTRELVVSRQRNHKLTQSPVWAEGDWAPGAAKLLLDDVDP